MEEVDLEIGVPLDFAELDLARIGGIKDVAVDAPRAQLFDLRKFNGEEFVDPFYNFVAGCEVSTVHHDVSIIK